METNSYWSKGYVQTLLTLTLVAAFASLAAYANLTFKQARGTYTGNTTITVSGVGEVLAKPDIGQFSFAVQAKGETATQAQELSAESINAIVAYLKEAGVEDKDIKTQNYSLYPNYRYPDRICPANAYCPPGEPIADGYEVSQDISVKVRDLEAAGELISGVGERGATNLSGLNFTIDDETELQAEARQKAIADSKEKAKVLAADLGMSVARIMSFSEGGDQFNGYGGMADMAMEQAYSVKSGPVPELPVGENTIRSTVYITYELK